MVITINDIRILSALRFKEMYGLEIIKFLKEYANTEVLLGSLYNTMNKLEKNNLITRGYVISNNKNENKRRHFKITKRGVDIISEQQQSLMDLWRNNINVTFMNYDKFIESLDTKEKIGIIKALEKSKYIPVVDMKRLNDEDKDWLETCKNADIISGKLACLLERNSYKFFSINKLTRGEFMKWRNTGVGTWGELYRLVKETRKVSLYPGEL